MRKFKKVFADINKLQELLTLREKGWSYPKLADKFGVDHTSVMYHCVRHGIKSRNPNYRPTRLSEETQAKALAMRKKGVPVRVIAEELKETSSILTHLFTRKEAPAVKIQGTPVYHRKPKTEKGWYEDFDGERINSGKMYRDYINEKTKQKNTD